MSTGITKEPVKDQGKEPVKQPMSESERMLNLGEEVVLKKLGKVIIRELSLENIIILSREIIVILSSVDFAKLKTEGSATWFLELLGNPKIIDAFKKIAAAASGKNPQDFENMGLSDWLLFLSTFKRVFNWEETKELFFQLIPKETLMSLTQKKS